MPFLMRSEVLGGGRLILLAIQIGIAKPDITAEEPLGGGVAVFPS